MKIAFLNISQGVAQRGAETFVQELAKRLAQKHEVAVITGKKLPPARWPLLWRFFIDLHGLTILWFTLKSIPRIWREKFDIVIPLNGGWQPAFVRFVTWLYGGKMIVSGQSGKGWDDRNNLWSFPDTFVALSSFLTKWAKQVNPFVKGDYIPNGVDIKKFQPEGSAVNFQVDKPIILCVGALTNEKRIELTIRAVARIKNGSLVVVGDGPLKEKLLNLGRDLLGERFLLSKFDFGKMPQVYRGADLFTLASPWYRAFEIVLVEAMATNLPVVANNDPIRQEIVGSGGLLVNPEDTQAYAKALSKALNPNWGNKPRKQAEKFSWDKIAGQYNKLFKELLHGK